MAVVNDFILEARDIRKSFSGVEVLHGVDFCLKRGQIHGLAGANGAGKSTLMKILNGVYKHDNGYLRLNGRDIDIKSPKDAADAGIAMVFQEFSLIPTMSVCENIFLAREPLNGSLKILRLIDKSRARKEAQSVLDSLSVSINLDESVENLPVGTQQIVEIAKALSKQCKILILDEPTASLSQSEIVVLFTLLRHLKKQGISIIIITHHLQEIMDICDDITVLRDGEVALSEVVADIDLTDIIQALVGQDVQEVEYSGSSMNPQSSSACLEIRNLSKGDLYQDISFSLFPGEVAGLAGLLGSGRTEILKSIYGLMKPEKGSILVNGAPASFRHPGDAQKQGVFFVPENRHKDGIIRGQSVHYNIMLSDWGRYQNKGLIQNGKAAETTDRLIQQLKIKTRNRNQLVEELSGGNQQKAVIARAIAGNVEVLLLDEPTVGVDIASKQEILSAVRDLASEGKAVLMVSSELNELAQVCDRIIVFKDGRMINEIDRKIYDGAITEDRLLRAAQGADI